MSWKPDGYPDVSPYLVVKNAKDTIQFCKSVFNAVEYRRTEREDGSINHMELRIGDSVIMLADATADWPPLQAMLHLYVADVDDTYRRALEAGAQSLQAPERKGDADKRGGVLDANGVSWWFATQQG